MHGGDLDPERVRERGEPAAALQRREPARQRDRAQHRRVGPLERRTVERLVQHARVEARVVRDEHAAPQLLRELGQHARRRRRRVDHRLRDPGEALDAARQRLLDADERAPALVQLAAADEHGADLGQLAGVAREPVRLRVDREELGGEQREVGELGHEPPFLRLAPDVVHGLVRTGMFISVLRGRVYGGIAAALVTVAGCGGGDDYTNDPRPPAPINVTAAITNQRVSVSPQRFGAGPIVLVISNQSSSAQEVTFETDELGGSEPGRTFNTTPINPRGTATLKVEVRQGDWKLGTKDGGIRAAAVSVGKERKSAQNELLQP